MARSATSFGPTLAASRTAPETAAGSPTGAWLSQGANTATAQPKSPPASTPENRLSKWPKRDGWLAGRRGIRSVTLQGYSHDLKAVLRYPGGKKLQQLSKADGDAATADTEETEQP
jgi:hypothetical protein